MRRLLPLLAFGALALSGLASRAEEPAEKHLELIQKLRAKGYGDLAQEYLERLKKNPPAGMAGIIPVELAKTKISRARDQSPAQRLVLLGEARTELEQALQALGNRPEAAQLRLEIARIAGVQGQALLSKALQEDDAALKEEHARKAEQQFIQAGKELEAAAKGIDDVLKVYKGSTPEQEKSFKKQLTAALYQARLERGRIFLDQATTYLDLDKAEVKEKRVALVDEGRKALEALTTKVEENPEAAALAFAWLIKASYDSTEPKKAHDYYRQVLGTKNKEAQPARRLARLLIIQQIMNHGDKDIEEAGLKYPKLGKKDEGLKVLRLVQSECQDWLSAYPSFKNTPEGQAVHFELARAYVNEAMAVSKDLKSLAAQKLTNQAQKILNTLIATDGDYSRPARRLSVEISIQSLGNRPVAQLKDFNECSLKGHVEMARVDQAAREAQAAKAPAAKEAKEAERKQHLALLIEAFDRAIQLADARTPAKEVNEARFNLAVGYLLADNMEKAARESEQLARLKDPFSRSATAAAYALRAYSALMEKENARDEDREKARKSLRDLATFITTEKAALWKGEPIVAIAQYQLALMALRDHDHARAVEHLEKLPADFSAYTFGQCQAAFAALAAAKDPKISDEERAAWKKRAMAALKRVPNLPSNPDSATVQMFFAAQIEQGKLLFEEGSAAARLGDPKLAAAKYAEMVQFVNQLEQQFQKAESLIKENGAKGNPKGKDDEKPTFSPRQQLRQAIATLKKFGLVGASDLAYRAGNYDQVLSKDLAGGVLLQVQALAKPGEKIQVPDFQVTGDILGIALRAQVQKGDIKAAQATLDLLQRLTSPAGADADPTAVLKSLLGELQGQLKELRVKGDQAKLKQTIKTFSAFIDVLGQRTDKKVLSRNEIIFLANCYSSLNEFDKAAKLYGQVQPPVLDQAKVNDEKYKEDFEKERQAYWLMQVLYGSALRQSKQLAEAEKVFNKVLTTKEAAGKLLAEKEQIIIQEDKGLYGTAIKRWGDFMASPAVKKNLAYEEGKKVYFEAYYHFVYCWFKYSQGAKVKGTDKEKVFLERAANYIVRLETAKNQEGWRFVRGMFQELLLQEPAFNTVYLKLKKQAG
jgi:hypothetical protein